MTSTSEEEGTLTINIRGLGHQLSLTGIPIDETISHLRSRVEELTSLPCCYQRLIIKGYTIDSSTPNDKTLRQLGLQPSSTIKGILMHSPIHELDKKILDQITSLNNELDVLDLRRKNGDFNKHLNACQHIITNICCKLDMVDVSGSTTLREMRRKVLNRAEDLGKELLLLQETEPKE